MHQQSGRREVRKPVHVQQEAPYSSSEPSSSTLGAEYPPGRCCAGCIVIFVSVAVVVAVAGAGWPVEAAKVALEAPTEDFDFFFFLEVCRVQIVSGRLCCAMAPPQQRNGHRRSNDIPHAKPKKA